MLIALGNERIPDFSVKFEQIHFLIQDNTLLISLSIK